MHRAEDRGGPAESLPLVSAVVPFRNNRATLSRSLAALAASTYPNLEIVLVDDASTDGSSELAAAFAEHHPCRIIRNDRRLWTGGAKNAGVREAGGDLVFFTDADVVISFDTVALLVGRLSEDPELVAVFGSYGPDPGPRDFFSRYKNLVHHFTHQTASSRASTFWGGCGLIRRREFWEVGGFSERIHYITDIDLGYRLRARGYRLLLDRDIQVTHWKRYSFRALLRSDLLCRAVPWTRVMLARRTLHGHLNLQVANVVSGVACWVILLLAIGGALGSALGPAGGLGPGVAFWLAPGAAVVVYLAGNRGLLDLARRRGGWRFALGVAGIHFLYYLYASAGFGIGLAAHGLDRLRGRGASLAGAGVPGRGAGG